MSQGRPELAGWQTGLSDTLGQGLTSDAIVSCLKCGQSFYAEAPGIIEPASFKKLVRRQYGQCSKHPRPWETYYLDVKDASRRVNDR